MEQIGVPIRNYTPRMSWAAFLAASHSLSYLLVAMLIADLSAGSPTQPWDQRGRDFGYQCENNPKCLCTSVYKGESILKETMVCEERISFEINKWLITMNCYSEMVDNPYKYLSVPPGLTPWYGSMIITGCQPPSQSYSAFLSSEHRNQSEVQTLNAIEQLTLFCDGLQDFQLKPSHFHGMKHLKLIDVHCPRLSNLSSNLLSGISGGEVELIKFTATSIEIIPDAFFSGFSRVDYLVFSESKIKTIHKRLFNDLNALTVLHLNGNRIELIEDDVFLSTKKIKTLAIFRNRISKIPSSLCSLRELEYLYAKENCITAIPKECFYGLVSLKYVDLSYNKLVSLNAASNNPKSISASYTDGHTIQEEKYTTSSNLTNFNNSGGSENTFFGSKVISGLKLDNNLLSSVPSDMFVGLPELKELDISSNRITELHPDTFAENVRLTRLNLSHNFLIQMPEKLLNLASSSGRDDFHIQHTYIVTLDLSENRIRSLDLNFFSNLTNLEVVSLRNNRIVSLPSEIFKPFAAKTSCNKITLHLDGNQMTEIPLLTIPCLVELNMARNRLTHIDKATFKYVPRLELLDLSDNFISSLGEAQESSEGKLAASRQLFGSHLSNLKSVDLSGNSLSFVPDLGLVISSLKALNLSGNRIAGSKSALFQDVPREASNIEIFDLSRNVFSLPNDTKTLWDISVLRVLKHLDLSGNQMRLPNCVETYDERRRVWGCASIFSTLQTVEMERVSQDCHVERKFAQATYLLGGNPLKCDCHVFSLLQYSLKESRPISIKERHEGSRFTLPVVIDIQDLHCSKPESIEGKAVSQPHTWSHHLLPLIGTCIDQLAPPKESTAYLMPETEE
ncbi:protein artichoke-like isoform X2 [Ischnura elegans]|uniref:protein artichoke-like isoform X2 n=1 Tax=Ischnura elegans TaxID=197161 RepID=UPI001ED896D0|nr:protein artichoke-like isoform X2 [Ischnura elegans]